MVITLGVHQSLHRETLNVRAPRRGLFEVTNLVAGILKPYAGAQFVHLFLQHTSASLIIQENADPSARHDLELFFERLVPFHQEGFLHTHEGPDDMPSHIKTALTHTALLIPAENGELALGRWQGIYLWEHREACPSRRLLVTVC